MEFAFTGKEKITAFTGTEQTIAFTGTEKTTAFIGKEKTAAHTPSVAFRHLPPNSARLSYATEGALFISAQLSTDAISALRKVRVLILSLIIMTVEAT